MDPCVKKIEFWVLGQVSHDEKGFMNSERLSHFAIFIY